MSYRLIPYIYSGRLPTPVHIELQDWNDELCFHGDNGCVFNIWSEDIERLSLFKEWMISIGAWTLEQTYIASWEKWQMITKKFDITDENYSLYKDWLNENNYSEVLTVAMMGT